MATVALGVPAARGFGAEACFGGASDCADAEVRGRMAKSKARRNRTGQLRVLIFKRFLQVQKPVKSGRRRLRRLQYRRVFYLRREYIAKLSGSVASAAFMARQLRRTGHRQNCRKRNRRA